ncbi:hypothetical protein [Tropicimonas aquimaris]|uniref:DUF2987 domain-containing protein n=1 Tax=Tropicimonas aquimaris TaxID=914152 RepID=A0ABW3IN94_9RHOB
MTVFSKFLSFGLMAALTLSAAHAGAPQCPTRDALERGRSAYVAYPDGSVVALRLLGGGKVQETTRFDDHVGEFRMVSLGGVFIADEVDLSGERVDESSRITTSYPADLAKRLPLRPDQEFTLVAENSFADGTPSEQELLEVRTGDEAEIEIAGCRVRAFPVLLTYRWGEDHFTSMMTHLPGLGISLELARVDPATEPEPFAPMHFSLERP